MKVETKYDAGQEVYFFAKGKIQCEKIKSVKVEKTYTEDMLFLGVKIKSITEIDKSYYIHNFGLFSENDLFATKEELLNSLK